METRIEKVFGNISESASEAVFETYVPLRPMLEYPLLDSRSYNNYCALIIES